MRPQRNVKQVMSYLFDFKNQNNVNMLCTYFVILYFLAGDAMASPLFNWSKIS